MPSNSLKKLKRPIFLVIILIIFALSISSLAISIISRKSTSQFPTRNDVTKNLNSIVEIKAFDQDDRSVYGTGFIVSSNGNILTNKHVVSFLENKIWKPYSNLFIRFSNQTDYVRVSMKKMSEDNDIALLSLNEINGYKYLQLENESPFYGDEIYSLSNSINLGVSFTKGVVSQPAVNLIDNDITRNFIQLDLLIAEGSSGAPVINNSGKVVGMITLRQRDAAGLVIYGYSFAIPSTLLKTFMSEVYN